MWETKGVMKLCLLALILPVFAFGCAASNDDNTSADESNLDTSGCSGLDSSQTKGAITVSAARPPTASCWNVDESGHPHTYSWTQKNDSTPDKQSIGFYVALNGGDDFQKAASTECHSQPSGGLGHDTSGDQYFTCTASKRFDFGHEAKLKSAAYGADGHRLGWDVQVAVALDDAGNWDSLNGANYRFSF
jgi:hypothetical protein